METRSGLVIFGMFVLLLAFAFVLGLEAAGAGNSFYGILALVGFAACVGASVFNAIVARREGSALEAWFIVYAAAAAVLLVWFLTRSGDVFS